MVTNFVSARTFPKIEHTGRKGKADRKASRRPRAPGLALDPETWVDRHGDLLYRYTLARVRDTQIAEELVQETFLAALRGRDRFAGRSSVRTWLFGILKHKIIDHIRKLSRERPKDNIEITAALNEEFFNEKGQWIFPPAKWKADPDELFEQKEFLATLHCCLSELPERMNHTFALRELDGLNTDEICKILNVSRSNVWVMLYRARLRLRECLEKRWKYNFNKHQKRSNK
jgi:RNA polymerase sigma-70 factor (ECF subfamily)